MRQEVREIRKKETIFIAEDGREFSNQWECIIHEKRLAADSYIEKVKKFEIESLRNVCPISEGLANPDNHFNWYKVNTPEEFSILCKAYQTTFAEPQAYPEIISIEDTGFELFSSSGNAYDYSLSSIIRDSREFWEKLGYEFSIKESEKKEEKR